MCIRFKRDFISADWKNESKYRLRSSRDSSRFIGYKLIQPPIFNLVAWDEINKVRSSNQRMDLYNLQTH